MFKCCTLYFLIKMNLWRGGCFNIALPWNSPAMQKELESSKVETGNKYLLLGPCYHLVNNVDGQRKMKKEILPQKMVESEDTAEIVRDIKAEKVEYRFSF